MNELDAYRKAFPTCEEHKPDGGARSACPICAGQALHAAISRIDYACGEPNEMEMAYYDFDYDDERVIEAVKALRKAHDEARAQLSAIGEIASSGYERDNEPRDAVGWVQALLEDRDQLRADMLSQAFKLGEAEQCVKSLRDENFALAAGQCIKVDGTGLTTDHGGVQFCLIEQERDRLRAELSVWKSAFPDIAPEQVQPDRSALHAEIARMRKAAKDLTEIVRMPNAEHVADAHNAAVRLLKEKHDE